MDLIEGFVHALRNVSSPARFRRWTGISMVSTALSQKVWTCIEDDRKLYPNTFIFLVGEPGGGKTVPMDNSRDMLKLIPGIHFCPDWVTPERVIENLGEVFNEGATDYPTYLAHIAEFATFMPEPKADWFQAIARLWDVPKEFDKQIKTPSKKKESTRDYICDPYMCILAGVQPAWFSTGFPQDIYEMGFPARTSFIWAELTEKPKRELFKKRKQVEGLDDLMPRLKQIRRLSGFIDWTPQAQELFVDWEENERPPIVDDPMLKYYNGRREMHAAKLALICMASRGGRIIEEQDIRRAWDYMFEAEALMPRALTNAGGNMYRMREEHILQFIIGEYERTKRHVSERLVRRRLGSMVSTTMVAPILNELVNQGRIKVLSPETNKAPNRLLKPGRD